MNRIFACIVLALALASSAAWAQVPTVMPFQARLTDNSGVVILPNSTVVFELFDALTAGSSVFGPETHVVTPQNGVVSVLIGSQGTPLTAAAFAGASRFLQITVNGQVLTPRLQLGSTAFAFQAQTVAPNSIGAAQIQADAITASEIATNAVTAIEIAADAVGASEIAADAVGASEITADAVGASEIAADAVGPSEIATNGVTSPEIADGTIIGADVLDGSLAPQDLLAEPGVASSSTQANNTLLTTAENLLSRPITVPAAGFVVAIASANVQLSHVSGVSDQVSLSVNTTSAVHGSANLKIVTLPSTLTSTGLYRSAVSVQDIFSVAAGTTTIFLVASAPAGAGHTAIESSLILMYFPTAYGLITAPGLVGAAEGRPTGAVDASAR